MVTLLGIILTIAGEERQGGMICLGDLTSNSIFKLIGWDPPTPLPPHLEFGLVYKGAIGQQR
jgi:hypothetical protein